MPLITFFKKLFWILLGLIILCVLTAVLFWYFFFSATSAVQIDEPRLGKDGSAVIYMTPGKSISQLAVELKEKNIIRSPKVFLTIVEKLSLGKSIKQGIYVFSKPQHVFKVINRLADAEYGYTPTKITFPEGYTSFNMARILEEKMPNIKQTDFMTAAEGKEGFLFPDTYFFYPYATSSAVIQMLENNFDKRTAKLKDEFSSTTLATGKTARDIIIMASILEKEVRTNADKAMVSDLFWRRMKIGMALQADSTLTYITGKTSAELTLDDLQSEDLYNSYKHVGLPPTPISNPGLESIKAALRPEPNEYLFFLSDKEGKTHFSKTYKEHLQLKAKYLD